MKLPEALRRVDERASQVEALDEDDFPAAALATLLSPAILLTHNFKDFAPLGVRDWSQGTDAVFAAAGIKDGETMFQGMLIVPAAPVVAVGAGAKWVADRVGPAGWFLLPLLGIGDNRPSDRNGGRRRQETWDVPSWRKRPRRRSKSTRRASC